MNETAVKLCGPNVNADFTPRSYIILKMGEGGMYTRCPLCAYCPLNCALSSDNLPIGKINNVCVWTVMLQKLKHAVYARSLFFGVTT